MWFITWRPWLSTTANRSDSWATPRKYSPEFVYARVTDGFRKMPAWKDVYSDEQRRAIVAYVLSGEFSP